MTLLGVEIFKYPHFYGFFVKSETWVPSLLLYYVWTLFLYSWIVNNRCLVISSVLNGLLEQNFTGWWTIRNMQVMKTSLQLFIWTCSTGSTSLFSEGVPFVILIDCIIFLSPSLDVMRISMSTVSFLTQLNSKFFAYRIFWHLSSFDSVKTAFLLALNLFLFLFLQLHASLWLFSLAWSKYHLRKTRSRKNIMHAFIPTCARPIATKPGRMEDQHALAPLPTSSDTTISSHKKHIWLYHQFYETWTITGRRVVDPYALTLCCK